MRITCFVTVFAGRLRLLNANPAPILPSAKPQVAAQNNIIPTDAIRGWAWRSRIKPFIELQKKNKRHYNAILATMKYGLSYEGSILSVLFFLRRKFPPCDRLFVVSFAKANASRHYNPPYSFILNINSSSYQRILLNLFFSIPI